MKDKRKQIGELSREICKGCKTRHKCDNNDGFCIMSGVVAEYLIDKGYGNVKQVVKEFKEQVKIELEKYRLDNEEKTNKGFVFNSSQFCVEVICDGGLIDEAFEKALRRGVNKKNGEV